MSFKICLRCATRHERATLRCRKPECGGEIFREPTGEELRAKRQEDIRFEELLRSLLGSNSNE